MAQQMSFYSAEACHPAVGDLAGLLCWRGRTAGFAKATARLTVDLTSPWRAAALVGACAERGVLAEVVPGEPPPPEVDPETGEPVEPAAVPPVLRTAFRADLAPLAARWGHGAAKSVPDGFAPDGATLRLWVVAAGRWSDGSYLLPLDPAAPATHDGLAEALCRAGLPTTRYTDAGEPALRITGRRRLGRLLELVGPGAAPGGAEQWPAVSRMRAVS